METNRNYLIDVLTLLIIKRKGVVNTSYFLHQINTRLGIFESTYEIITNLINNGFIKSEGLFDESSKLYKNIMLTEKGEAFITKDLITEYSDQIKNEFNNIDILEKLLII